MTEKKTALTIAECEESLECIFGFAIAETRQRLADVAYDEREDNRKFDRIARTAVAFMRVAQDANALLGRIREEKKKNGTDGADADHNARIAADAAVLKRELDEHIYRLTGRGAAGGREADGGQHGEGSGDRA